MLFNTVAKTKTPPKTIPLDTGDGPTLLFADRNTIMLYNIGKNTGVQMNPDDLDLSNLSVQSAGKVFSPIEMTVSDRNINIRRKIAQIALLIALAKRNNLVVGRSYADDSTIQTLLRQALSDEIENKDEVVSEFVTIWNDIAGMPQAQPNLGRLRAPYATDATIKPIFTYHAVYEDTFRALMQLYALEVLNYEPIKNKIINQPAPLGMDNFVRSLSLPALAMMLATSLVKFLLGKTSIESYNVADQNKAIAKMADGIDPDDLFAHQRRYNPQQYCMGQRSREGVEARDRNYLISKNNDKEIERQRDRSPGPGGKFN